jgi:hypothetical protein
MKGQERKQQELQPEQKQGLQLPEQVLPAQQLEEQLVQPSWAVHTELRQREAPLGPGESQLLEEQQVLLQPVLPAQLMLNLNR